MKKREFDALDESALIENPQNEAAEILAKLRPDEYCEIPLPYNGNILDTGPANRYIALLRQQGIDIGKGNAEFGYRMPLPEKDEPLRVLQIFRRR